MIHSVPRRTLEMIRTAVASGEAVDVLKDSGGLGSWLAGRRVKQAGPRYFFPLFTDTLVERADLYVFLIAGARNLLGTRADVRPLLRLARNLPPISDVPAEMDKRKRALARLRGAAMRRIPGFVWLAEGRTPWEVFRAERYIGDNRHTVCKKILKAQLADRWIAAHFDLSRTTVHVGIDWSEEHRLERLRTAAPAFRWNAPLCAAPYVDKPEMIAAAKRARLPVSRAYPDYPHDNCSGGCIQQGQGGWAYLYRHDRHAFNVNAREETRWQREVGNCDVAVLRDRSKPGRHAFAASRGLATVPSVAPLTLYQLARRIERGGEVDHDEWGGCGCGLGYDEPAAQRVPA